MESVKISKWPKLRNPWLIAVWPGMGDVGYRAALYLVEKLKAEEFASIAPEDFFYLTGSVIHEGVLDIPKLPYGKFYYWKNPAKKLKNQPKVNDLIIFVSNAQPDLAKAEEYTKRIIKIAKGFKVKMIVSLASMPQPIEHTQESNVWVTATYKELRDNFKKQNYNILSEGQVSGMNGLLLGIAKNEGFEGFCLLGEIPFYTIQIENPRASYALLRVLTGLLNIQIDFTALNEQIHAMDEEINKLLDYLKIGAENHGPIGEEEIERIKKSLSQLTKLPGSVKDKIEKLFNEAKTDVTKANELKEELDRWNIYKEHEDRFLDLFKKKKKKDN
ncbi:MAG: PAC2 family protein [Candidatus Omnitrophota bacterium]|nr:PAC2 family protein [Candidatus Omnitrophota bacterium]